MTKGGRSSWGVEEWKREMDGQKLSCVHNRRKQSSNPYLQIAVLKLFLLLIPRTQQFQLLVLSGIFGPMLR